MTYGGDLIAYRVLSDMLGFAISFLSVMWGILTSPPSGKKHRVEEKSTLLKREIYI